jgi:hypothetical protein
MRQGFILTPIAAEEMGRQVTNPQRTICLLHRNGRA